MKAVFIRGPLDGKVEDIAGPPFPRTVFGYTFHNLREGEVADTMFKQIEYNRTLSSEGSLVYVAKEGTV